MAATALAALFIQSFSDLSVAAGPFRLGLLHLFVPLTAYGVYGALATIRAGDIAGHRGAMRGLYFGGPDRRRAAHVRARPNHVPDVLRVTGRR